MAQSRKGTAWARASAAFVLLLGAATAVPAPAGIVRPGLFGSREIHSEDLNRFPKWRESLTRFEEELRSCAGTLCNIDDWNSLIMSLQGREGMDRLSRLNRSINRRSYIEDFANWRELDYWATPLEFLARSGDCEDFAIAKYQVLRALGMAIDDMRIVIVNDRARRATHAVLAVYVDGRPLILDNLRDDVVAADLIGDYEPVYSINEQGWWLHRR
ncbi:MAG: transglutaminase-like cysteine peptidase [Dongiaceae bacterium]